MDVKDMVTKTFGTPGAPFFARASFRENKNTNTIRIAPEHKHRVFEGPLYSAGRQKVLT